MHRFPSASDIQAVARSISNHAFLSDQSCLRLYFYHARPAAEVLFNPISKKTIALGSTQIHSDHAHLLQELEKAPDFALRLGETDVTGWKVGDSALRHLVRTPRPLEADDLGDLVPAFKFARREGLRVVLCHLGHRIKRELFIHADRIMTIELPTYPHAQRTPEDAAA